MKTLVILGSPRGKQSSSARIAEHFETGLRKAGCDIEEIVLRDQDVKPCRGCFACWTKTPGRCVQRDDMDKLLPALSRSELVIYAFPLYIFSTPGIVKNLLDRQIPLSLPELIERDGITAHPPRETVRPKKNFLISVAGFPELSHFDGLTAVFEKSFASEHNRLIGKILVGGAEMMRFDGMQGAYADLYQLVETAGREVGLGGAMTPETEQAIVARTALSESAVKAFRETANQYWKSFSPVKAKTSSIGPGARELKMSDGGLAAFWAGMALQYNPEALPGFEGCLQFRLDEAGYFLAVGGKTCRAYAGASGDPVTTITTTEAVWMDVAAGKTNGQRAVMDGRIKVSGDFAPMLRLSDMFRSGNGKTSESSATTTPAPVSLPDQRGPIRLKGSLWLNLAFAPWIAKWVWGGVSPGPLSFVVPAACMLGLFLYHLLTNRPTLFEIGSLLYLAAGAVLGALKVGIFTHSQLFFDNLFMSLLWLGSLMRAIPLTAEYSRFDFPKALWTHPAFLKTNAVITGVWGFFFLAGVFFSFLSLNGLGSELFWRIAGRVLLVPMIVFTVFFQKWYPSVMLRKRT